MRINQVIAFISSCLFATAVYSQSESQALSQVSYSSSVLQMLLGLLFVVAMIFAVVWLMKKLGYQGYTSSGHITIKSTLALSSKEKILLLQVGEEQVLVGVSASGINHIKTLDQPVLEHSSSENNPNTLFSEKLKLMLTKSQQAE